MDPADEADASKEERTLQLDTETESDRVKKLKKELQSVRKELGDVRKELAAKTIQLSKRESKNEDGSRRRQQQQEAEADVQGLRDEIEALKSEIGRMQERLEDAKRTQIAQEKALSEATATAEAASAAAASEESARLAYESQAEYETDKLQRELSSLKSRTALQLQQKASEIARLESQTASFEADKRQAVREAQEEAGRQWAQRLRAAEEAAAEERREYERRLEGLRDELSEAEGRGGATDDTYEELASARAEKSDLQREFEKFREMAAAAARERSAELTQLLEENSSLRAKLASQGARPGLSDFGLSSGPGGADEENLRAYMERLLQRRSAVFSGNRPVYLLLAVAVVTTLFMLALLRALVSARGPNRWLCVLEKLGLRIGEGCMGLNAPHMEELLDEIIEEHPRAL